MSVELNHIIIPARSKWASAKQASAPRPGSPDPPRTRIPSHQGAGSAPAHQRSPS